MNHDDHSFLDGETRDFWADDRTRPLERLSALRRPAGNPPPGPSRPRIYDAAHDDFAVTRDQVTTLAHRDPRRPRSLRPAQGRRTQANRRLALMAIAFVLLVPVALMLRGGDADGAAPGTKGITLAVGSAPGADADVTVSTVEHVPPRPTTASSESDTSATATTRVLPSLDDPATTSGTQPKRTESAAPASAPATTAAPVCTKKYTIVGGDSWSLIASKVKVAMRDLLAANNASTSTLLLPGRTVCLPANATLPAPTPTTVKAPSTTVAAPPASRPSYSSAQVQQIIRDVWPDELEAKALTIAQRESGFNTYDSNWCCYGAFQINWNAHKGWMAAFGVTSASQLYDPRVNARMALEIYHRSNGWGPWGG